MSTASRTRRRISTRAFVLTALAVCLVVAGVLSSFASSSPDGLEHVAATQGFEHTATEHHASGSPLAGYQTTGVRNERLSGGIAGLVGVGLTTVVMGGLLLLLRRRPGTGPTDLPTVDAPRPH